MVIKCFSYHKVTTVFATLLLTLLLLKKDKSIQIRLVNLSKLLFNHNVFYLVVRHFTKMTADSLATTCKCHGVSGSCSLKTCWMALPEARILGSNLQKKYFSALEVDLKTNRKTRERRLVSVLPTRKSIAEDELIYCTISPDYCLPDKALGSVGTKGR